jgi:hypothetical protein
MAMHILASRQGGQAERTVRQRLWAHSVKISAADETRGRLTCVIASEIDAPAGIKPIEWRLIFNRAVPDLESAVELIDVYRCRWEIETLFHVLKNGCRVEALQLDSQAKLELSLTLYLVVSRRIAHVVRLGRIPPDLLADLFFAEVEWTGAYVLNNKKQPKQPPPVRDVVHLIAKLGGFPGAQGRWRTRCEVTLARHGPAARFRPRGRAHAGS